MRLLVLVVTIALLVFGWSTTAHASSPPYRACVHGKASFLYAAIEADLVVVGSVQDYEVIDSVRQNSDVRRVLGLSESHAKDPLGCSPCNMAFFKIAIEEVLRGEAGAVVDVIWNTRFYHEPANTTPPGQYLFALDKSKALVVTAPITSRVLPDSDPDIYYLKTTGCLTPSMFAVGNWRAKMVRELFEGLND